MSKQLYVWVRGRQDLVEALDPNQLQVEVSLSEREKGTSFSGSRQGYLEGGEPEGVKIMGTHYSVALRRNNRKPWFEKRVKVSMERIAMVKSVLDNGMAQVAVQRETACGAASCADCAGCEKMMTRTENVVVAYNDVNAHPGMW